MNVTCERLVSNTPSDISSDASCKVNMLLHICWAENLHTHLGKDNDKNYKLRLPPNYTTVFQCRDSLSLPFPLVVKWWCWCQRQTGCHGDGRHCGISRGWLVAKWSRASATAGQVVIRISSPSSEGRKRTWLWKHDEPGFDGRMIC